MKNEEIITVLHEMTEEILKPGKQIKETDYKRIETLRTCESLVRKRMRRKAKGIIDGIVCNKCGKLIEDVHDYCPYCGHEIRKGIDYRGKHN